MLSYDFMKNAFLAVLLITPLFGLVGTMVVNNKLAFFSDALGHSALTGIALGVLLGIPDPLISMGIFSIIFAILLNSIKHSGIASNDTVISVFSSASIALGLVLLSRSGSFAKYSSYLLGDILTIDTNQIKLMAVIFVVVLIFWLLFFNKLLSASTNASLSRSRGINIKFIETLFIVLIAMIVTVSIKWTGILLINSLLILPAAASRNISRNIRQYHLFSVIFSTFSGLSGLTLSFYLNLAAGPVIVLLSAIVFFITFLFRKIKL